MARVSVRPASVNRAPTIRNEPNGRGDAARSLAGPDRLEVRDALADEAMLPPPGRRLCQTPRPRRAVPRARPRPGGWRRRALILSGRAQTGDRVHDKDRHEETRPRQSSEWKFVHEDQPSRVRHRRLVVVERKGRSSTHVSSRAVERTSFAQLPYWTSMIPTTRSVSRS